MKPRRRGATALLDRPANHEQWNPHLPAGVELRPVQVDAVRQIVAAFEGGAKMVFWEAPTGVGKTFGAVAVADALRANKVLYTCSGLQLQDQFSRDFLAARVLKGRSNYIPPLGGATKTCVDCDKVGVGATAKCSLCPEVGRCPYTQAKQGLIHGRLGVVNITYLLTEANGPAALSGLADLVVVDEADVLEAELGRYEEYRVSAGLLRVLRMAAPGKGAHVNTVAAWMVELAEAAKAKAASINTVDADGLEMKAWVDERDKWVQNGKRAARMAQLVGDQNWVRVYERDGEVLYKPVTVAPSTPWNLWAHAERWLCMSATLLNAEQTALDLGLADDEWVFVSSPCPFEAERRPVVVAPVTAMSAKNEVGAQRMAEAVGRICDLWPNQNVLVHTHTYKLAALFAEEIGGRHRVHTYKTSFERASAVQRFTVEGGVLLAPSLDRGVDLPDDLCRVVVVAKIPFPYMGDRQVSTRMHLPGGQRWFALQAARSLVQMTGRGMRHQDDWCVSYVLDGAFNKGLRRSGLLPDWWLDAVVGARANRVLAGEGPEMALLDGMR